MEDPVAIARSYLAEEPGSSEKLAEIVDKLAKKRIGPYGQSTASEIWDTWSVIADDAYSRQDPEKLIQTFPIFLSALEKKPYILPHSLLPHQLLGEEGVDFLVNCVEIGLKNAPRKGIETLDSGTADRASEGMKLLVCALERIVEYGDSPYVDREGNPEMLRLFAEKLAALKWTDDRIWVLFRALSENQFAPHLEASTGAVFLPIAEGAQGTGEGLEKLKDLLQRAGHLAEEDRAPVSLPEELPHNVEEAFDLAESLAGKEDLEVSGPARKTEITALVRAFGSIPDDLKAALSRHSSLGEVHFGPPDRMISLRDEMKEILEEHLKEYSELPPTDEKRDVRDYKPFEKGIPLGTDHTGDIFFLATNAKSDTGHMPVIRFHHDEALTSSVEASSLGEFLCFELLRGPARREGLESQYNRLVQRKRSAKIAG